MTIKRAQEVVVTSGELLIVDTSNRSGLHYPQEAQNSLSNRSQEHAASQVSGYRYTTEMTLTCNNPSTMKNQTATRHEFFTVGNHISQQMEGQESTIQSTETI